MWIRSDSWQSWLVSNTKFRWPSHHLHQKRGNEGVQAQLPKSPPIIDESHIIFRLTHLHQARIANLCYSPGTNRIYQLVWHASPHSFVTDFSGVTFCPQLDEMYKKIDWSGNHSQKKKGLVKGYNRFASSRMNLVKSIRDSGSPLAEHRIDSRKKRQTANDFNQVVIFNEIHIFGSSWTLLESSCIQLNSTLDMSLLWFENYLVQSQ